MLIFGHVGITLGTSIVLSSLQNALHPIITRNEADDSLPSPSNKSRAHNHSLANIINRIDIRILLMGSLLPDMIDKPIGHWLFKEYFSNGCEC